MKVNVIGLGYIGLPTALMLSSKGIQVTGTDNNLELVESLTRRSVTFNEDGLDDLFQSALKNNIEYTSEYIQADIYIIAVPTPYEKSNKKIDPQFVVKAVESVLKVCPRGAVIIIESTISPGTIDKYIRPVVIQHNFEIGKDIHLVHAPERIIPGRIILELENNSRTIGADEPKIGNLVKELYANFCKGKIVVTDIRTAEMTKVVENTYRDINIAFANELAKICRMAGLDVYEIIRIANMHPRVNILQPGPGVGGHCISVDPWFLVGDYPGLANIILTARKINDSMPEYVLERISAIMEKHNINAISKIGLYGLTYKEDVDDVRESPTLQLLEIMRRHLATGIKVYDPMIKNEITDNQYQDFDMFIEDIDLLVIMVGHSHLKEQRNKILDKVILDTRNVIDIDGAYLL